MPVFDYRFMVDASPARVRRFHDSPEVLALLTPPPMRVEVHQFGKMEEGMVARFTLGLGPFNIDWEARHEEVSERGFTDVQVSGPLESWRHTHKFTPLGASRTEVWEHIEYRHRPGVWGLLSRLMFARPALWGLFTYRRLITRRNIHREP